MIAMVNSNTAAMNKEVKLVKVVRPVKEKDEKSVITSKKTSRTSPRYILKRSINALQGRDVTNKTAQAVLFVGKVVVLEALRRVGHTNLYGLHRPLLWTLQGLSGLNCLVTIPAPPFSGLQRWAPIRFLARATEGFAKPILFLSLAGLVTNAYKHRDSRRNGLRHNEVPQRDSEQRTVVVLPNTVSADDIAAGDVRAGEVGTTGEVRDQDVLVTERQALTVEVLKEELDKNNVALPEWFDDGEVQRFWSAAHGDTAKFVRSVRNTIGWRQRYQFLSEADLKVWKHLVFWHKSDAHGRPTLIIRLGLAYTALTPSERPLFAQAIVSQVEHRLRNKMPKDDPRLTVVMDCRGTSAFGFPLNLIKSCSVLVQEHYPTRLAALFVINLPPIVQVLANAVLQVIKPSTKEKVHMEGDRYMIKLASYLGGIFDVPVVLGGKCSCDYCEGVSTQKTEGNIPLLTLNAHNGIEEMRVRNMSLEEKALCIRQSTYESYSGTLRVVITGLFLLWLVVAMISGYGDPHVFLS